MPAKKHNFTVVEIKAGLMVIVSGAVLLLFIAVMSGMQPAAEVLTFYARFTDTGGLNRGADVRFGGSKVGRVTAVSLDEADQSMILVEAQIAKDTPVNEKSVAFVTQTTLTAEKHLAISTGEKTAKLLADGAAIPTTQGSLFDQAGELARSVQQMLADVKDLIGVPEAKEKEAAGEGKLVSIADLFENVNATVDEGTGLVKDVRDVVTDSREDVSGILTKVQDVGTSAQGLVTDLQGILAENRVNIQSSVEGVQGIVTNAGDIVSRVSKVSENLDALADSVQAILDNAESLSGGAKAMLEQNRPVIEDMLVDLRQTVQYLKDFSRTMAEQPQAVIRGKTLDGRR